MIIANLAIGFIVLVFATIFIQSLAIMFGFARRDAYGGGGTSA